MSRPGPIYASTGNHCFEDMVMNYQRAIGWLLFSVFTFSVFDNTASAASGWVRDFQTQLYAGQTDKAASIAKARVIAAPGDDNARFAMGAVQFLHAIEQLGRMLHRYGLQSEYTRALPGLMGLPILRLPVPDNPKPDELSYAAFRNVLKTFVANLAMAEAPLAKIKSK
jgi:hypothetical protein